jgi:hypothetical protein
MKKLFPEVNMQDDVEALVERFFRERASWPELIKAIRGAAESDIVTAQKIALSHEGWRRLCNVRINQERQCRKQALSHLKIYGADSFVIRDGDTLVILDPKII